MQLSRYSAVSLRDKRIERSAGGIVQGVDIQSRVVELTSQLVKTSSLSGEDRGGLEYIAALLQGYHFTSRYVTAGGRTHLLSLRGEGPEYFAFSGHTDVVPAGEGWCSDPFAAEVRGGRLFGRGVADMKGAVAAFIVAVEQHLNDIPNSALPIAFLIAGDEETDSAGTPALLEELTRLGKRVRWCLVGEPSATTTLGDGVRVGRRGSLSGTVDVQGVQGHVAYPQLAHNPIHDLVALLSQLSTLDFDGDIRDSEAAPQGDPGWPKTSFQMTLCTGGVESATNVIPGSARARFNIRFRPPHTRESLVSLIEGITANLGIKASIRWSQGPKPYDSKPGAWRELVCSSIKKVCGKLPELSRDGGTSDGRFIAHAGADVIEVGPCNATIHKIDENLEVSELVQLVELYKEIIAMTDSGWGSR